jgi:hypothetical protein
MLLSRIRNSGRNSRSIHPRQSPPRTCSADEGQHDTDHERGDSLSLTSERVAKTNPRDAHSIRIGCSPRGEADRRGAARLGPAADARQQLACETAKRMRLTSVARK